MDGIAAIMFGAGTGAWVYSKMSRHTGGNVKSSAVVAACVGGLAGILLLTFLKLVLHQ